MRFTFGSRELRKALVELGFCIERKTSGTRHVKYCIDIKPPPGLRPFIIVIDNTKSYDKHTASSYVTQIRRLGFTNKQIEKAFEEK